MRPSSAFLSNGSDHASKLLVAALTTLNKDKNMAMFQLPLFVKNTSKLMHALNHVLSVKN